MHITSALRSLSLAVCMTTLVATAHAAPLKTDTAKSSVLITFKQLNVPVDATFKSFDARIDFDATKPALGKASIDINIASFDLGEAEYNKEVMKKDWFNTAQFPKANFISSSIKPSTPGKFDVTGKLTIKGKTSEVHFSLAVNKTGANQVFDGTLPIKRLTYNIGEGEWKDTGMVADEVLIKFHIVAQ